MSVRLWRWQDGRWRRPGESIAPTERYGPIQVASISELIASSNAPSDANYRVWSGNHTYLQDELFTMGSNDILVLPEREQPYLFDASNGFNGSRTGWVTGYRTMCRMVNRGLVGLGPGAVVGIGPGNHSTFTRQADTNGNIQKICEILKANAYVGNFSVTGRDLTVAGSGPSCGFDFFKVDGTEGCHNVTFENLYFKGAHRGWLNEPPGECGAITHNRSDNFTVRHVEIDCRDENGVRVGSSPIMLNNAANSLIEDCYLHHAYAGMFTHYGMSGTCTSRRVRSEYNGSAGGKQSGTQFNFERNSGVMEVIDCTMIAAYGTGNTGLHMSANTDRSPQAVFNVRNPTFDTGPSGDFFSVYWHENYGVGLNLQPLADIHILNGAGVELTAGSGWRYYR